MNKNLANTLIDKVKEKTGSDYKTAQAMGFSRQVVSDWRNGRRPMPPEDMALLASLAGMDASAWLVRGVLAKHEGTPKGERLLAALGKSSAVIGVAIATGTANAAEALKALCSTMYKKRSFYA
jgi:phytoene/squalene synthetase